MNWKHKSLVLGSSVALSFAPTMSLLASCGKSFDQVLQSITDDIQSEFLWICKHYRNTYWNREFCHDLVKRIKSMGFTVRREWDEEHDLPLPYKDGKGNLHYRPEEGDDKSLLGHTTFGYDITFDIPANTDDENYPTIALQAHTDMVCSVVEDPQTKQPIKYDWSQGTIPVVENGWMHTKDWKTSLGADDGAGVAIMLSIAKHHKEFKHGLIRCIFTVDEEDGPTGAKYIPNDWLDGIDYYLNLDSEHVHVNWNCSAGSQQSYLELQDIPPQGSTIPTEALDYHIRISNLAHGHSGLNLGEDHMNGIILMGLIVDNLINGDLFKKNTGSEFTDLRIRRAYENGKYNDKSACGQLVTQIDFWIQGEPESTTTIEKLTGAIKDVVDKAHEKRFQTCATDNPVVTVEAETGLSEDKRKEGITHNITKILSTILSKYDENKIYWYQRQEGKQDLETGCYTGCVRIGDAFLTTGNKLYLEFFARGVNKTILETFHDGVIKTAVNDLLTAPNVTAELFNMFYSDPWMHFPENKLQKTIHEASDFYNNELKDETVFAWMEISEVATKHPNIHYGAIGPEIESVHTPKERLEVDTIPTMTKLLVYILQHLQPR